MTTTRTTWWVAAGLSIGLLGCVGQEPDGALVDEEAELDDGKYEAWNYANNPAFVDRTFVLDVAQLPLKGVSKIVPFPSSYWPTYEDNLNKRWDGDELSPAEKFEKAFNRPGFSKVITEEHGAKAHGRKECTKNDECTDLKDGSVCTIPRGDTKGACIPTWWGICHGWAPYAFSEAAPSKPVVKNGVTFYPGDIEALGSLVYSENLPVKFLSERCNKKEPGFDNTGRVRDGECRDMNPGAFHVVATNMLGLRGTSFVYDRTAFDEVWNQPVRDFKVLNGTPDGKLKEITKDEAIKLLGLEFNFSQLLAETDLKKGETKTGTWTATADGEAVFKTAGTGDADLWVKIGAPAGERAYDCKSEGGTSAEECRLSVKTGNVVNYYIKGYVEASKANLTVGVKAGAGNYAYNVAAKRFFHVSLDIRYITEGHASRTSLLSDIDKYTVTDHYDYILETDENARIVGGEWLGDSRKGHPDFAWWPTGKPTGTVVRGLLSYADFKSLSDQSAAGPAMPPQAETKELIKAVAVRRSSSYATVGVPPNGTLTVKMTGTGGNADLYVRLGAKPTVSSFSCKSTGATAEETCTVKAPTAGGTYYVRARPVSGTTTVTVTATVTPAQ